MEGLGRDHGDSRRNRDLRKSGTIERAVSHLLKACRQRNSCQIRIRKGAGPDAHQALRERHGRKARALEGIVADRLHAGRNRIASLIGYISARAEDQLLSVRRIQHAFFCLKGFISFRYADLRQIVAFIEGLRIEGAEGLRELQLLQISSLFLLLAVTEIDGNIPDRDIHEQILPASDPGHRHAADFLRDLQDPVFAVIREDRRVI